MVGLAQRGSLDRQPGSPAFTAEALSYEQAGVLRANIKGFRKRATFCFTERIHGSWRELFGQPDGVRGQPDEVRGQPDEVRGPSDEVHGQPNMGSIYGGYEDVYAVLDEMFVLDEMYEEPGKVLGQPHDVRGQPDEVRGQPDESYEEPGKVLGQYWMPGYQVEEQYQETISNSTTESDDINNKDEEIQTVIYREQQNSREATFIRTRSANTSRRRQTASVSRSSSDVSYELNLLSDGPPSHSESDTSDAEPNSVRQYSPSRPGRVNIANVQRRREAFNSSARWVSRNKMPEQSEPRDPPRAFQECHRRMSKQVPTSTQSLPNTLAENPDVRRTQRSYGWPCVQETGSVSGVEEACGVEHNRGARYREIQDNHSTRPPSRHSVVKVKADVDVNCHPALLVILGGIVCFCLISLWLIGYSVRR